MNRFSLMLALIVFVSGCASNPDGAAASSVDEERQAERSAACDRRMVSRAQCLRDWDIANPE